MKYANSVVGYDCKSFNQSLPNSPDVVLVGSPDERFYQQLGDNLAQLNCAVLELKSLSDNALKDCPKGALVLLFIGALKQPKLYEQVRALLASGRELNVVPVVEYADQQSAAHLLEIGCVDYLLAPFSHGQLQALLARQAAAKAVEESFVCRSQSGRRLLAMAQRVAQTRAPILITGETGTGKELMARYIHAFASDADAPFVAVNCAAIPEQMLESILFGHERGAFTGAVSAQPGKFELANGGTLLLDEVGELPLALQAKLLRVLQEQSVERLGARKSIKLNVRIIAATNRNLTDEVAQGRFRADLMFRLDVLPLHISPLRERLDDVLPLAKLFIRKYAPHEGAEQLLTEAACQALRAHHWPGNVRELENTVQRALVLRNGLFVQPEDLGLAAPVAPVRNSAPLQVVGGGKAALKASGKWAEYQHVLDTIRQFDGHKTKAAESLGMTTRALRYRLNAMRQQGVDVPF